MTELLPVFPTATRFVSPKTLPHTLKVVVIFHDISEWIARSDDKTGHIQSALKVTKQNKSVTTFNAWLHLQLILCPSIIASTPNQWMTATIFFSVLCANHIYSFIHYGTIDQNWYYSKFVPWIILPIISIHPWSRVLFENLTGFQLVKKFPAFYGTRRFITAFTIARHLSLSWVSSI